MNNLRQCEVTLKASLNEAGRLIKEGEDTMRKTVEKMTKTAERLRADYEEVQA